MKDPKDMTFNDLKTWLRDRLQMRGAAAADINFRIDEAPYERPVQLWKSGSDEFRDNFKRAVLALIEEVGKGAWSPEHFHELALLIEEANLKDASRPLETIAQNRSLLKHETGQQLHMLALRTLLAVGWTGSLDFWLAQEELVGDRWPGIIFDGLAQQDVALAFDKLPELVDNQKTMRGILDLFPGLMRDLRLGISTLSCHCSSIVSKLPPDAAQAMRNWFSVRKYPLDERMLTVNSSLIIGIRKNLPSGESAPRHLSPFLVINNTSSSYACSP